MADQRYLEEKLRDAVASIRNPNVHLRQRVRYAYSLSLANLEVDDFPDDEGRQLFEEIRQLLTQGGEILPEEGSVSSSLWRMNDEQAQAVADKILDLARHYGQDESV